MEKYFTINEEKRSIRCKIICGDLSATDDIVIFGHGFGGHKDNRAAARLGARLIEKNKRSALITFDWPCHGEDARKTLTLEDCADYLRLVTAYARGHCRAKRLFGCATSFGGYLYLKAIGDGFDPFEKTALRCPAVNMYEALTTNILTDDERAKMMKGKPVEAGFDRKVRIEPNFLEELKKNDITKTDYLESAEKLLILHGTKDEIISFEAVRRFADDNLIEFVPVLNADHRFSDPKIMDLAVNTIIRFYGLK